ncbi:MAG: CobW family GTP-binding protein, partial [Thermomicrobiales bacterium]
MSHGQAAHAIPVLVVSGFLGSGKTTLIRALLADPRAREAALIVNEFGEVGIDHHLLRHTDERTTLLRNGCVCCSLRDDLSEAMRDLLSRRERGDSPPFGRVIIETTGLADPGPILHTIVSDPVLRNRYRMDRALITLDAVAGLSNLETYGEALRQVAAADLVVLTKLDLAPPTRADDLRAAVRAINPAAVVVEGHHGRFDLDLALDEHAPRAIGFDAPAFPLDAAAPAIQHAAAGRVTSHTLVFDDPLDWRMFGIWLTMLLHRHGERVLRMKWLLNVGGERGPLLLEGVQHVMHAPRHLAAWPDDDRRSRLVFITRDLDIDTIRASLEG